MEPTPQLLSLPPLVIVEVLRRLDGRSLVALEQTNSYFSSREPGSRLPLVEHIAMEQVLRLCQGSHAHAQRFRHRSWRERLHLEEATGAGFDRAFSEDGGFCFQFSGAGDAIRAVRLTGMGPKLLVSDSSTREQSVLRWRLRVKGNTAVEFGVVPADLPLCHTGLHKCVAAPDAQHQRAMGFCSQITAGSLLPLKAPVMRGTVLDLVARRGHLEVVLEYPEDAKEISWQNGQPVQRPYHGPSQLRFEQDFPADYDVRLAVTSWAKAHFEVLHTGYAVAPGWAAEAAAAEAAAAEADAQHAAALPEALQAAAQGELELQGHTAAAAAAAAVQQAPEQQAPEQAVQLAAVAAMDASAAAAAVQQHAASAVAAQLAERQPAAAVLEAITANLDLAAHPAPPAAQAAALPRITVAGCVPLCPAPSADLCADGHLRDLSHG